MQNENLPVRQIVQKPLDGKGGVFLVPQGKADAAITGLENAALQLFVAFLTVALFVGVKQGYAMELHGGSILPVCLLGLVNTGIGCYFYFSSIGRLRVQTVALCGYLEPLSAVIFAAVVLGENMSPLQLVGAVCILGGAMAGELGKKGP